MPFGKLRTGFDRLSTNWAQMATCPTYFLTIPEAKGMSTRKDLTSTLLLVLFGAGYLAYSTEYPMNSWNNPGPRVFPLIAGSTLAILAVCRLIQTLRTWKKEEIQEGACSNRESLRASRPFSLVVVFIVYILMIKGVGFFLPTVAFVVMSSRLMGAKDWVRPLVLALGVALFCYFLFEVWLKLSLPRGFLF